MKFPAWAKAYEQQAAADTNKPPFKVEDQARISALATELEKLHLEIVEKDSEEKRKKALECTEEIIRLLPRDNNSKGGNSQQNQNQNKNDQNNKDENKDDNQSENQEDNSEDDSQNNDEKEDKAPQPSEDKSEKEIENVLKKAQERSDEHEAQKKAREMRRRLPPNERDW